MTEALLLKKSMQLRTSKDSIMSPESLAILSPLRGKPMPYYHFMVLSIQFWRTSYRNLSSLCTSVEEASCQADIPMKTGC